MQDNEIFQEIEELIIIQDMKMESEPQNQDVNLMSISRSITIQSPPPQTTNQALNEEEEIVPLDDGPIMDMYIVTYDEIQKNILQERKKQFLYKLMYPTFIRERVIVTDTKRNP